LSFIVLRPSFIYSRKAVLGVLRGVASLKQGRNGQAILPRCIATIGNDIRRDMVRGQVRFNTKNVRIETCADTVSA
jgi:hypothetical protein